MKKLLKFVLLGFLALLFTACSTTPMENFHKVALIFETEPSKATITCDGKELGKSPINYSTITDQTILFKESDLKEIQEKYGGNLNLPKCKARWVSGYEDYFATTANVGEFKFRDNLKQNLKFYTLTKRLTRPKSKGYNADAAYANIYYSDFKLTTNPAGAQIICENGKPSFIDVEDTLKGNIIKMTKCKAIFVSGYEMAFRDRVNIDKEDPSVLLNQTLNRPNTKGYADDMRWALELEKKQILLEKKQILEANERARTQALQAQVAAQQRAAAAAEAQAKAAQEQAQAAQRQATMQMLSQPSNLDKAIQQSNEMIKNMNDYQRNQSLQGIDNSLRGIDRSLDGIDTTIRRW